MSTASTLLVASAGLCWAQVLTASLLRARAWTIPGLQVAFGNREAVGPLSPLAGRATRAGDNMIENLVIFAAVLAAAWSVGADPAALDRGATIFFWGRIAHAALYLAGIPYLRTAAWFVSVVGIAIIGAAALP